MDKIVSIFTFVCFNTGNKATVVLFQNGAVTCSNCGTPRWVAPPPNLRTD